MSDSSHGELPVVLVIDDDETFAEVLAWWLMAHGYDPVVCTNAVQAHAALSARRFAAVVSDIELGGGVIGTDVVAELRRSVESLPAIFVSGFREEFVDYDRDSHLDAFLQKPFDLDLLGQQLERYTNLAGE